MSAAHVYSCSPVVDNGDLDDLDDRDDGEDKAHCACAVFGVFNCPAAASSTVYYGLHALQHRGQECAGIASLQWDAARGRHRAQIKKDFGLVLDVFNDQTLFTTLLTGSAAVGHTRYSTSGSDASPHNIQPFMVNYKHGNLMLAHNGNVSNAATLRRTQIDDKGVLFQSTSDSELVLHLMAQSSKRTPTEQLLDALQQLEGAFSFIILTDECMYGVRDPNGFRPLCLGRLDVADKDGNGPAYCLASETCAFDLIGATYVRDVEPGEVVKITTAGCRGGGAFESFRVPARFAPVSPCIFEYVYFSRPDSMVFGQLVDTVRHRTGEHLAFEHPVPRVAPNEVCATFAVRTLETGHSTNIHFPPPPSLHPPHSHRSRLCPCPTLPISRRLAMRRRARRWV